MRLIDADALIEALNDKGITFNADVNQTILEAPKINQWIPCSERLPKIEVLCCDKYGEMIIAYVYADTTSDTGFSAESETQCMYNCVAWMPLPEPFRGDSR